MIKKKHLLMAVVGFLMIYPAISAFLAQQKLALSGNLLATFQESLISYQLSIWITWIVVVLVSIYYKWTTEKNIFFFVTYIFLVFSFGFMGFLLQEMVNKYDLNSGFEDNYSFGVFTALLHFAIAAVLTGFLQGAVWWFTRRWHRR